MTITNREEFKDYCLRRLGHPVIEINVDDDQVNDRIDDAFIYFQQFDSDAMQRTYLQHQVTSDDIANTYINIPDNVIGVSRIFPLSGSNLVRNMFDIRYQLRLQDIQSLLSASMSYYYVTQTHLALIDQLLVGKVPVRFNRYTNRLYIDWDWKNSGIAGEYLIVEASTVVDPDQYPRILNDRILKALATAYIKRQWGANLKKYTGVQLPGGIMLNGQIIFDEAEAEIQALEKEVRETYELPLGFYTG